LKEGGLLGGGGTGLEAGFEYRLYAEAQKSLRSKHALWTKASVKVSLDGLRV
jgi:hypothetical protein